MDIRAALKEQFHAGLAMLLECVELCSDELWLSGQAQREVWRIAFHAAFFTQYGFGQSETDYLPWPDRPVGKHEEMWLEPAYVEPYELAENAEPFSRAEGLAYVRFVDGMVDDSIDNMDFERDSGFQGYASMRKLSNVLMNLRHLQGHVGQLSELLIAEGIETTWVGKGSMKEWKQWESDN